MIFACEGRGEDDLLSSAREQKAVQRELIRPCQDKGSRRMGGDVADRVGPFDVEALERGWRCRSERPWGAPLQQARTEIEADPFVRRMLQILDRHDVLRSR
jgi:hypothetical protein